MSEVLAASNLFISSYRQYYRPFFLPQGMVFDLEKNCSLHVDLAKSNSRSKRLRSGSLQFQDIFPGLLWVLH